jgi:hypothetical protein
MRKSLGVMAAVLFCSAATAYAEDVDNPIYKHWAKFKPGTSVTAVTTMEIAGNKTETKSTTTLKEVTADKVVVDMNGFAMEFKAKVPKGDTTATTAPKVDAKTSTEEVEVAGKKYKCTVTEVTTDVAGQKATTKSWSSEDMPGMMVKSEMSGMMSSKTAVTEVTIK